MEGLCKAVSSFTVEKILQNTHFMRVLDVVGRVAFIHVFSQFLTEHPGIKLVVIDSMAFHFRFADSATMDFGKRARMLFCLSQQLEDVARRHEISVVATNQMTQRNFHPNQMLLSDAAQSNNPSSRGGESNGAVELVPALGDSWAHTVSTRLLLRHPTHNHVTILEGGTSQLRHCSLLKSPSMPKGECVTRICNKGIRSAK